MLRASAVLILTSLVVLLIRKNSPELSQLLSITAVTVIGIAACGLLSQIQGFISYVRTMTVDMNPIISTTAKCVCIALVSRITSDLCRDASQSAAASAMEFIGSMCALCVSLPLILSVLKTIGGLL